MKDFTEAERFMKAAIKDDIKTLEDILNKGIDPNISIADNNTALHWASYFGKTTAIRILLQYGADVNVQNTVLWTPLHSAALTKKAEAAAELIASGAKDLLTSSGESWTKFANSTWVNDVKNKALRVAEERMQIQEFNKKLVYHHFSFCANTKWAEITIFISGSKFNFCSEFLSVRCTTMRELCI